MTEDISLAKIQAIGEVIQKNIAIVQQALGIEVATDDRLDELGIELEIAAEKTVSNFRIGRLTASELAEEKRYIFAMRDANRAKFLENQAMFAESLAKFNRSKDKFVQRTS